MRITLILLSLLSLIHAAPTGFLERKGNKLFLGGKEYRAIGVNLSLIHI